LRLTRPALAIITPTDLRRIAPSITLTTSTGARHFFVVAATTVFTGTAKHAVALTDTRAGAHGNALHFLPGILDQTVLVTGFVRRARANAHGTLEVVDGQRTFAAAEVVPAIARANHLVRGIGKPSATGFTGQAIEPPIAATGSPNTWLITTLTTPAVVVASKTHGSVWTNIRCATGFVPPAAAFAPSAAKASQDEGPLGTANTTGTTIRWLDRYLSFTPL